MAAGHAPFAFFNRAANPFVTGLLRSPLHRLASGNLALITVTGRLSGREYTFPVGYSESDGRLLIGVGAAEQKRWWRNLRQPAPVRLRLRGAERTGIAMASGDEQSGVTVEVKLDPSD
jgi:hypothetical protein